MAVNVLVMEALAGLWYDNHAPPPGEREGEEVRAMHQDLSPREREVVALVAQDKTNAQVALDTRSLHAREGVNLRCLVWPK